MNKRYKTTSMLVGIGFTFTTHGDTKMIDFDKTYDCPECGEAMGVWLPIYVTPGEQHVDTDMIDYGATPKWSCEWCGCETPPCLTCAENKGQMAPTHNGSARCQSGSIASGGNRSHCTCDICF